MAQPQHSLDEEEFPEAEAIYKCGSQGYSIFINSLPSPAGKVLY
jgi:hypothetical protein